MLLLLSLAMRKYADGAEREMCQITRWSRSCASLHAHECAENFALEVEVEVEAAVWEENLHDYQPSGRGSTASRCNQTGSAFSVGKAAVGNSTGHVTLQRN